MLPTTKTPPRTSLTDLTVLVYGPTKIGKTTWCAQADPTPLTTTAPSRRRCVRAWRS